MIGARVTGAAPQRQTELPVAGTTVILALEHDWLIGATETADLRRFGSFAGGLSLGPAVSEHAGAYDIVQFDLTPAGTVAVLGTPPAALAETVEALSDVVPGADELTERLAWLPDWPARFAALDGWLRHRIDRARRTLRPDVALACDRLLATGGRVRVARLQEELGCSRRHLASRFAEEVGVAPKTYARLVRFTRAADRLRAGAEDVAAVAAACGYSDQAHLAREVRAFAGATPVTLLQDGSAGAA